MAWVPIDAFLVSQLTPIVACLVRRQYPSRLLRLSMFFTSVFIIVIRHVDLSLILVVYGVLINLGSRVYISSTLSAKYKRDYPPSVMKFSLGLYGIHVVSIEI